MNPTPDTDLNSEYLSDLMQRGLRAVTEGQPGRKRDATARLVEAATRPHSLQRAEEDRARLAAAKGGKRGGA